jgi:hypothetical protein
MSRKPPVKVHPNRAVKVSAAKPAPPAGLPVQRTAPDPGLCWINFTALRFCALALNSK